jgi:hypothetical protein
MNWYYVEYDKEIINGVLEMYVSGMSVKEISFWVKLDPDVINKILDTITPYL